MDQSPGPYAHWLRLVGYTAAAAGVLTGVSVLVAWWADVDTVKSILPGLATMKPNTALAFTAAGVSIGAAVRVGSFDGPASSRTSTRAAAVVAIIGAATEFEYLARVDVGIDQLLATDDGLTAIYPGRMAPATAAGFTLLGVALLTLHARTSSGRRPTQWLILPVAANGYVATLGYLYDVESLYRVAPFGSMAVHTALMFVVLSIGFLCVAPDNAVARLLIGEGAGSLLARRLLPAVTLAPPVVGWIRLAGERAGYYELPFGLALFATSNVVIFAALVWWTARAVQRADDDRAFAMRELESANVALARSNEELNRFAYVASHDLVAPLRSVHGFLELLQTEYARQLDERARGWISRSMEGAKRMEVLIHDLLAYARLDATGAPWVPVALDDVLHEACRHLDRSIAESACSVTADPLPIVLGDRTQLLQLVQNLLANALTYRGDAAPSVHVSSQRVGDECTCRIRDNGIGIAAEHHEEIFQLFRRLHGRSAYPGTGIGLAVCRRIVTRHGGRIWVESTPGGGSTFAFTLRAGADRAA